MMKLLAITLMSSGLIASLPVRPSVKVQPPCHPVRGGLWSRLAYPLPTALYSQPEKLEVPSPDGKYRLLIQRKEAHLKRQKGDIEYHGLYVAPFPRLRVLADGKPLKIIAPRWFNNSFQNANYVLNDGAEVMWAMNSKSFVVTENFSQTNGFPNEPHAGNWRVLVYRISGTHVHPIFVDQQAGEAYQKTNECGMWPDMGALKWTGTGKLLLLAQGWPTPVDQGCHNPHWIEKQWVLGYLVAVPSGKILQAYTQQDLARLRNILGPAINPDDGPKGQPYLQGHC